MKHTSWFKLRTIASRRLCKMGKASSRASLTHRTAIANANIRLWIGV
jgi:hypothetical protein